MICSLALEVMLAGPANVCSLQDSEKTHCLIHPLQFCSCAFGSGKAKKDNPT